MQPDFPDAHYNLANALTDQGKTAEAIEHFHIALRVIPSVLLVAVVVLAYPWPLKALRTRVYLADEAAVRADPALASIARSPRIRTLVAAPSGDGSYRWDVRLQGEGETVFFAF